MADNENNQHGSFNYEPTIGEVKSLKPFIFWTQTTLPTVFDDSLSYYEAMSKIAKMLNTLLENENTNAENIIELKKAYDKTKEYVNDYFANLDLTSEVNTKIEEMYADGRLTDIVVTKATQLVTNYLYGEDGESGVNKDINDMISEAQTDIEEALANFATRSNLAVTTFETNSAASIRTFEGRVDQELAGVSTIVEDWMDANFTNPSSVVIDDTLTTKDAAAEAYATGKLMDDATNMVLATSYWQDYVVDSVSGSFILADVSGGSNPAVGTGAPSKTLYIANVTPGETYIVSGVASSYSTTRYTPAYALGNLTYDASDNPYYEFYDVYPRGWDESQDPGTVYQYVRNQTVRIPTGTTPTVTHLFIVGDSRVPITVKCSRLNARTDTALTSETLPAQGKATGDALETKLPWPVSGGNKDLGTAGYGLVTNADGTTSWQEVGGDYDEEIENLQNDVVDLKSALEFTDESVFTENIPSSASDGLYSFRAYLIYTSSGSGTPSVTGKNCSLNFTAYSKNLLLTLGLSDYEWHCWSYSSQSWSAGTHSNTNKQYISGETPILVPHYSGDAYFIADICRTDGTALTTDLSDSTSDYYKITHAFKVWAVPDAVVVDNTLSDSGKAADASETGKFFYRSKNRTYNLPVGFTWWEAPNTFNALNPVYPADVPENSFTAQLGKILGGFIAKGVPLKPQSTYWLFCFRSFHNTSIRFYLIFNIGYREIYICQSFNSGSSISVMSAPGRKPTSSILWLGDSISRGRLGGQSANAEEPIPNRVSEELNCVCENFGIGNIGWCAGWTQATPNKTNAIGYLKRVGNPDYYDSSDSWSGYKFLGSGDWSDFNTIVLALGTNDNNYPLGSLSDIDDTLDYATVMSWKTSAQDSDASNRTIVKAIYQCYRFIRESEAYHSEGDPYVPNGKYINIILSDPIISGDIDTGTPPEWGYNTVRTGGFTRKQMNQLLADFAEKYGLGHISNYDAPIDRVHLGNSLPDGVHPNETTYQQLGRHFAGKLSALVL